jgi:hypothetical protein
MSDADNRGPEKRARYLARTTDLEQKHGLAVAYAERGFSESGIAEVMDTTAGTVRNYLDMVAETYGPEAVHPTPADDRGDLVALDDQPTTRPADGVRAGRMVVVESDTGGPLTDRAPGPHVAERYFRTWTQRGRVHREEKVAFRQAEFDGQVNDRLNKLPWDDHHAKYDPDYGFVADHRADGAGAWTFDADPATLAAVENAGAYLPDLDDVPVVAETQTVRADDARAGTCPACHDGGNLISRRGTDAYPSLRGPAVDVLEADGPVTHLCLDCRRLFVFVPEVPVRGADDGAEESSENVLVEAME